jgi:gliding motility-associated-like protein
LDKININLNLNKMKLILKTLFFFTSLAFAQQQASNWYFGYNAGVKFNSDGTVTALTDGQLFTDEGCASLSDNNGNLLFYTDGVTIFNKNHQVMPNGNNLMGDSSTTQSATIVPMPGSATLFYVFTLDAFAGANGFRYSVVDMAANGGLGAVTAAKNVLIYSTAGEKIAIVKHANGTDYWVVTHGWNNNTFYSHLLTNTGVSNTPVVSSIGAYIGGQIENVWGYMKISPNGKKLAVCNSLIDFELFDFDNSTGGISNEIILATTNSTLSNINYGVEFSPDSNKLYFTLSNKFPIPDNIAQYDLLATDIPASKQIVFTAAVGKQMFALQLAPNNKIYICVSGENKLYVINNPNSLGATCNVQNNAVNLLESFSGIGLPSFASSFFYLPSITTTANCVNVPNTFSVSNATNPTAATWNFGDGNSANGLNPSHTYTSPGNYTVAVTVTSASGTANNVQNIVIHPQPTVNHIATLKQCDDNLDGFSAFNLNEAKVLLTTNPAGLTFSFHETLLEATSNTNAIANTNQYTNQSVSNDALFVRIANANGCYKTAQLNLVVSTTQIPVTFQKTYTECDDTASGSNTDGITTFNLNPAKTDIANLYPPGQLLDITFYKNLADALAETNAINNIGNYTNTGYPNTQDLFVRVDSQTNNECLGLGKHITLQVETIPIVQPKTYAKCDDNQDGTVAFDTSTIAADLLNGLTNVDLAYWDQNNNPLPSPLPNPFNTVSQTIKVNIKNKFGKKCDFNSSITFKVYVLPQAFQPATNTTTICDDETDPNLQNGTFAFDTSNIQNAVLGNQAGMIVQYFDASNNPFPSPLPNPFVTQTQTITAVVINPTNTNCTAKTNIPFVVLPTPKIQLTGNEQVCSNNPNFTKIIDAGLLDPTTAINYSYKWFFKNSLIPNETNYSLTVNTEGLYKVETTNAQGCTKTRTITVKASEKAKIDNVLVTDLSDTNSIVVIATGLGDYQYSLDDVVYQDSNTFVNVLAGIYTIYVKDKKDCGTTTTAVSVLGIPKFFTPNGDSYNDYWNIKGINQNFNKSTTIYIFDRFGKLLKQMSALSQGWDGTFNSQPVPANDYWYHIVFEDGKSSKGHFSLKR